MSCVDRRYDFVYFFDVVDGNPNGDPDAANMPRIDAETGIGLVTDVCIKRKVRNYVYITRNEGPGYGIFVKEKAVLNNFIDEAREQEEVKARKTEGEMVEAARNWMCRKYYDVRAFGAVMSTGKNAGQVRGPIQLTFARSLEPIVALEHSITRMAVATEAEAKEQSGGNRTMGRKYTVPYGLYRAYGFVSAHLAAQTGFSKDDLDLFWEALQVMFEHDRSAARGLMSARALIVFEHETALGNKPAHELFERVTWERTTEGPARSFSDYALFLDGNPITSPLNFVSVK
ncbi:CRISPR-associated protein Cas7/Csd2, subtype I-C/DVULG [Thermanaerovibrio velox DSM 12556]|uniref:CRISPR-associated protein Cas7/Csd2, subtype I-C/DVULG n=1 Tax=Thermanaerovibrio velox DSM 12556 TaxID=926567 RepID=H0UPW9_9BACT|nr:type I-C CRISPR-associated protein Cas7/Csd2 [Thermanaerovibrio velox]EHM10678.1 CRISPR-associated protein Cas7/Csd2, subtype I-C/DVULG [Thermanaerovibrio velox DSM 12556]